MNGLGCIIMSLGTTFMEWMKTNLDDPNRNAIYHHYFPYDIKEEKYKMYPNFLHSFPYSSEL